MQKAIHKIPHAGICPICKTTIKFLPAGGSRKIFCSQRCYYINKLYKLNSRQIVTEYRDSKLYIKKKKKKCIVCKKLITANATRCLKCWNKIRVNPTKGRKRTPKEIKNMKVGRQKLFDSGWKSPLKGRVPWNKGLTKQTDIRLKQAGEKLSNSIKKWHANVGISDNTRFKMRESAMKRIVALGGPSFGKNETKILDVLQDLIKLTIKRNYYCFGYAIDGYIPELNISIEIDEPKHYDADGKLKKKDVIRQINLENFLKCKFIRIKERDFKNNGINCLYPVVEELKKYRK